MLCLGKEHHTISSVALVLLFIIGVIGVLKAFCIQLAAAWLGRLAVLGHCAECLLLNPKHPIIRK